MDCPFNNQTRCRLEPKCLCCTSTTTCLIYKAYTTAAAPVSSITIKSCPWCGSSASLVTESINGYPGNFEYYIKCTKCEAIAPKGKFNDISLSVEEAKHKALDAWNRRI